MPDEVTAVEHYTIGVSDRPGAAAHVLAALKEAGVNLLAFAGNRSGRRAELGMVPQDPRAFKAAARKLGFDVSRKQTAFLVEGGERCGAAADIALLLSDAGVNLVAITALCAGAGRYGAIVRVDAADVKKTRKALAPLATALAAGA